MKEGVQYVNLGPGCLGQKTILHKVAMPCPWNVARTRSTMPDRDERGVE